MNITFKDLYQVLLEDLTEDNMIKNQMSYLLRYNTLDFEVFNNAIEVKNRVQKYEYLLTTFTNGIMFYDNISHSWWSVKLDDIKTKEDIFNVSIEKGVFDLDLDLIRYIENIMLSVRKNLYNSNNNLKVESIYGF